MPVCRDAAVQGISARSQDDLVKALGWRAVSNCQVNVCEPNLMSVSALA